MVHLLVVMRYANFLSTIDGLYNPPHSPPNFALVRLAPCVPVKKNVLCIGVFRQNAAKC